MAILLVFYNDTQGSEQPFRLERRCHRDLVTNV
jgi:hypothetical protein